MARIEVATNRLCAKLFSGLLETSIVEQTNKAAIRSDIEIRRVMFLNTVVADLLS